jgi:alpha-aminoadipate/glutamate carrier protein LysW
LTSGGGESKYYQGYLSKIPKKGIEEMASNGSGGIMVLCPECETNLDVEEEEVDEGEIVSCPECGTDFEVVTTSPLELKAIEAGYVEEEEEVESEDGDES